MADEAQGDRRKGTNPIPHGDEQVIPVLEEQVHIDTAVRVTGTVNVSTTVSSRDVEIPLTDTTTTYREVRVPLNQAVETMPRIRYEGDKLVIPVVREEEVVVKRLILVEELHLIKETRREDRKEQVTLRSETVSVRRQPTSEKES